MDLLVSLLAVLTAFAMREPLLVLARQTLVWRAARPETKAAQLTLVAELPVLAICSIWLWARLPHLPLIVLGLVAAGIPCLAVWMALRNRQRSILLQILSSAALSSTCFLAAMAATGGTPDWAWTLWGILALHSIATIFVVRARLHARAKGGEVENPYKGPALAFSLFQISLAVTTLWLGRTLLSMPFGFSAIACLWELALLRKGGQEEESIHRVGWRTLTVAVVHAALAVLALW